MRCHLLEFLDLTVAEVDRRAENVEEGSRTVVIAVNGCFLGKS